jgi:hypothetical protein
MVDYNYSYEIGLARTTTNLEALSPTVVPAPKGVYSPGVSKVRLGNGLWRWLGLPTTEWRWGFLSQAQRDMLRTFCTGTSALVSIRTRLNDSADSYGYFDAILEWPAEDKDAERRLEFTIKFTNLIPYTPSP